MSRHYDGKSNLSPDAMKRNPANNDPEFRASAASRLQKPVYRTLGNLLKGLGSSLACKQVQGAPRARGYM